VKPRGSGYVVKADGETHLCATMAEVIKVIEQLLKEPETLKGADDAIMKAANAETGRAYPTAV
jgi:SUMO ligase MMS21 Smc5/6 complex component